MPKASKDGASQLEQGEGFDIRSEELDAYTVSWASFSMDFDAAPLFRGLPDDRCQSPHWGVVLKGKIGFRSAQGEETFEAGEAFYVAPGHTPIVYSGSEYVEFSPTQELNKTSEVVARNMQEMGMG